MGESAEQTKVVTINLSPQDLWKVAVALAAAFIAALGTGFATGLKYQESQSNITIAEAKGSLAQHQAKLEVAQNRAEQLNAQLRQWQSAYQKLQSELAQQQQTVASLAAQLGRSNNCDFIREQVVTTQRQIDSMSGVLVGLSKEATEKERERISALQRRLEGHQQQLGICNK